MARGQACFRPRGSTRAVTVYLYRHVEDLDGNNPLGVPGEFEFLLECALEEGTAECLYSADGTGHPAFPGGIEICMVSCRAIQLLGGARHRPEAATCKELEAWYENWLDTYPAERDSLHRAVVEALQAD